MVSTLSSELFLSQIIVDSALSYFILDFVYSIKFFYVTIKKFILSFKLLEQVKISNNKPKNNENYYSIKIPIENDEYTFAFGKAVNIQKYLL